MFVFFVCLKVNKRCRNQPDLILSALAEVAKGVEESKRGMTCDGDTATT